MNSQKYDVAVIGSGVGGMCAAGLLSHWGYKTIVVERMPTIGGRCSTLEVKGFKLTTGAIGMMTPGPVESVFTEVGLNFDVIIAPVPVYRIEGKDYLIPPKGGLHWLFSQLQDKPGEADRIMNAIRRAFTWKLPSATISTRDWLLQYTQNEKIISWFNALIGALMLVNVWELPASAALRFLSMARGFRQMGVARRGNLALWEALAGVIRGKGGEVWTNCPVKQIVVINGAAKGVVVDKDGKEVEIAAQAVVSNTGPKKTVELAETKNFEKSYLKELSQTLRPSPILWIQCAIDRPTFTGPANVMLCGVRRTNTTMWLSSFCPELSPKGKHLFIAGGAPVSSLPPYDFKKDLDMMVLDLKDNFPEFAKYGEVLMASSYSDGWPGYHTWPGFEIAQRTSIENLYNVGDGVVPGGYVGTGGCAESARKVAEDIKSLIKPIGI